MNQIVEDKNPAESVKHDDVRIRRSRWLKWGIEILVIIAIIIAFRVWQQRHMVSGPPPLLKETLISGEAYGLPLRPEKPIVVYFWATWCPLCKAEKPVINAITKEHDVISVALWSGETTEIRKYVESEYVGYKVINDAEGSIAAQWGVHAVPTSFVIGTDGNIRFREVGYTTEWGMRLRLWFAGL